jgi:3',5'-cyclic AMP phosphodiesterase CpdA
MSNLNRRNFLRFAGLSLGLGTVYTVAPGLRSTAFGKEFAKHLKDANGETVEPFSFIQLSDTHVGFNGPPDPLGTAAFEQAVKIINNLPKQPDFVLFTGDLTHDSEDKDVHSKRMTQFADIVKQIKTGKTYLVPGEHDAGLDGGQLFRERFGETHYSFDHKGVHFIAIDNVSRAKPEVGAEQIAWLKADVERFSETTPIVVFTHRPLFDLKPEWEWFTSDGDDVMNVLAPYRNVTVLYGHIHRDDEHEVAHAKHYAARSLIFAFPDPEKTKDKKPNAFDKEHPFQNLGIRNVDAKGKLAKLSVQDVELTLREYSGVNGIQQLSKAVRL